MGKIVITEFISLDGVIEDPGGSEDFEHGGWTFEIPRGDEGDRFKLDEAMGADALLLGRRTYEGFAEAWPERDGEFADKFNSMPKYVVSNSMERADWNNSTVIAGDDLPAAIADLREKHEGDIVVNGSATLSRALIDADLVDELRLMLFPVVLGSGLRLFGDSGKKPMELADSQVVGDGVAILTYRPTTR